jgi:hypothetical protein
MHSWGTSRTTIDAAARDCGQGRDMHAVINFVTYNRTETKLRPQFTLYAGALTSVAISSLWFPSKQTLGSKVIKP